MTPTVHKTDQELQTTITDELACTPNIDAARLGVSVHHGIATLSGDVATLPERHAAMRAALRVSGVKAVTDKMSSGMTAAPLSRATLSSPGQPTNRSPGPSRYRPAPSPRASATT